VIEFVAAVAVMSLFIAFMLSLDRRKR